MYKCGKCKCNSCTNSVDDEFYLEGDFSCFNCDECYLYGRDNNELVEKFKDECNNYKMRKVEIERQTKEKRLNFKIIRGE